DLVQPALDKARVVELGEVLRRAVSVENAPSRLGEVGRSVEVGVEHQQPFVKPMNLGRYRRLSDSAGGECQARGDSRSDERGDFLGGRVHQKLAVSETWTVRGGPGRKVARVFTVVVMVPR